MGTSPGFPNSSLTATSVLGFPPQIRTSTVLFRTRRPGSPRFINWAKQCGGEKVVFIRGEELFHAVYYSFAALENHVALIRRFTFLSTGETASELFTTTTTAPCQTELILRYPHRH